MTVAATALLAEITAMSTLTKITGESDEAFSIRVRQALTDAIVNYVALGTVTTPSFGTPVPVVHL